MDEFVVVLVALATGDASEEVDVWNGRMGAIMGRQLEMQEETYTTGIRNVGGWRAPSHPVLQRGTPEARRGEGRTQQLILHSN